MATPRWQRQRQELPLGCWEMQQNPWGGESLQGTSGAEGGSHASLNVALKKNLVPFP